MRLLAVNTGSSSVKLALYEGEGANLRLLAEQRYAGESEPQHTLQEFIASTQIDAIAHRIVHGGTKLTTPCVIDANVEAEIERLAALAPLHNPRALIWLRACRALLGMSNSVQNFPD